MPPREPISVVMPVHNAAPYLDAAVRSILGQTLSDFEFVILDDGSTDGSSELLREWAARDPRIRLLAGDRNLGPAASSNAVVREARGALIARMDADDISDPSRLARQVELLASRPDVALVGTLCDTIDGSGRKLRGPDIWRLTRSSWLAPFTHGSIMYRREMFDAVGGYRDACEFWEDQDFVLRVSNHGKVVTIPSALYQHRHSRISTRLASERDRVERSVDRMYRAMDRLDAGRSYEDLLRETARPTGGRIDPQVFISLGSLVLWAGGRPRLFRRLLTHGRFSLRPVTLSAMVWTLWASASPSSLRVVMGMLAKLRNRLAPKPENQEAVEWRLPRPYLSDRTEDRQPA